MKNQLKANNERVLEHFCLSPLSGCGSRVGSCSCAFSILLYSFPSFCTSFHLSKLFSIFLYWFPSF